MRVEASSGSVQQVFLASAVIAGCIAFTIGLTDSFVHPETPILEDSWERVAEEARRYVLPEEPMLLRDSPMQAWLKGRDDLWGQGPHWWQGPEGISKAVSGSLGDLKVRLQSGKGPFVNHDAERYMAYGLASGRIGHDSPHKHTKIVTLREALARVWASVRTPGNLVTAFLLRISGQGQCVTDSLDSVAPQLAAFMPSGCLRDDSYFAELRDDLVEADVQKLHDCRQFTASFSLGANGVPTAARYDFSHSLLLQVVGTKRITLLPPSAQHRLHLYPYWHGSRQQSQLDWSAASLAFEQDEVAEEHHTAAHHAHKAHSMLWDYIVNHGLHEEHGDLHTHVGDHKENIQRHADSFPNATVVTLEQGELLFVPSMHFIVEESLDRSATVRWGSGGLARDVWNSIMQNSAGAAWPATPCGAQTDGTRPEPLSCARAQLATLHGAVATLETHHEATMGLGILVQNAGHLLDSRYNTKTLPLLGSKYQGDAPLPSAGRAEGAELVQRTCLDLRHTEMAAVGNSFRLRKDPPVDDESREHMQTAAHGLMLLDGPRRELMLWEVIEHAAAWAVAEVLGSEADGAAVRAFVQACCSRM